ncbi:MAG: hypothetical protein ACTSU5_15635 [Promethearchaeota archaeon]
MWGTSTRALKNVGTGGRAARRAAGRPGPVRAGAEGARGWWIPGPGGHWTARYGSAEELGAAKEWLAKVSDPDWLPEFDRLPEWRRGALLGEVQRKTADMYPTQ